MDTREIVVFGAGIAGEKFIYQYCSDVNISCFWDNKKTGDILGYQIKKPEGSKNCFILVASVHYFDIRMQLTQMGYKEFTDFIPVQIFRKKMVVAYGNCHMEAVRAYLERHKTFSMEYGFYPFPAICEIKAVQFDYSDVLQHCDLFLHQSIRKENVYGEQYSSEYMLKFLTLDCIVISCPNLYGMPKYLFPQLDMDKKWKTGLFRPCFIDSNIVSWIEKGENIEKIKSYIIQGGVYKRTEIIDMWEKFVTKLKEREKGWDIKVIDYILDNQKKIKIFCDINHITSETAREISGRILKYMGYEEQTIPVLPILDALEVFVYTDVKEALGLEFKEKYIRKWNHANNLNTSEMNFDEYIRQVYAFTKFELNY